MFNIGDQVTYEDGRKAIVDRNVGGGDYIIRFSNGERLATNQRSLRAVKAPTPERPATLKAATPAPAAPAPAPVVEEKPKAEEKPADVAPKKRSRPKKSQ